MLAAVAMIMAVMPLAGAAAGTAGDTVEGPGVYMDNVWITTSTGQAQYLTEAATGGAMVYGAPNITGFPRNGCIDDFTPGEGFADVDALHDYTFEFKETVSDFSLRMVDFGDFNPSQSKSHEVVMTAYLADGTLVDVDTLSFTSSSATNPDGPSIPGGLWFTGDACTAVEGEPGNWVFDVAAPGIAKVTLQVLAGLDPKIAFTDMDFTSEGVCVEEDVTWEDYEVTLWAGQNIDAGTVTVSFDETLGEISVAVDVGYPWKLSETHVAVVSD